MYLVASINCMTSVATVTTNGFVLLLFRRIRTLSSINRAVSILIDHIESRCILNRMETVLTMILIK